MKRNIIGAVVIMFITIAFLVVIDDLSKLDDQPAPVNVHKVHK